MLFALALGYLLGSIPFGLVLTRLTGKGDIRDIGSGNIGATNVLRTGSKPLAALTLILDCLKATAAILLAQLLFGRETGAFAAAGAMIGHLYPVWLRFRRRQGRRDLPRCSHRAAVARCHRLCRRLAIPAADAPNLVACRNDGGHQRADRRFGAPFVLRPAVARFRGARPVEAPREYPSPEERNRATNRIEDLTDRLRLLRTPGIGPVTYRQLIARFGTPAAALAAVPDLARRGGGRAPAIRSRDDAEREIAKVERFGARFLALGQGLYPRLLAEIEDAPPLLIAKGDLNLIDRQSVAIVGARNASAAACRFARGLAHDLGQDGVVIVSGLARGVDSAAHDGALASGTIGIIAGGIDVVYPPENSERQHALYERGLVIAEMPPGTEPRARHFPYRNRIIAGISSGTVVVEAAPRSGSLITARLSAEAGREVMAVPGSPLDPRAQGCNQLIRDGATLVQTAADVIEAIRMPASSVRSAAHAIRAHPRGDDRRRGCAVVGREPARPIRRPGRRDHSPVGRRLRRGSDGAPRAGPRRAARAARGEQGQPEACLTNIKTGLHLTRMREDMK